MDRKRRLDSDNSSNQDYGNEYVERKRHKHMHEMHKMDSSIYRSKHNTESKTNKHYNRRHDHRSGKHQIRSRHQKLAKTERRTLYRKRERHQHSRDAFVKYEMSTLQRPIKMERISDESDGLKDEQRPVCNISNHSNRKEKKENMEGREKWGVDIPEKLKKEKPDPNEKEKIDMGLSGKLAEDTNTYNGVVIKYSQPPEARKPKRRWRWYIFKGDEELPFLPLHRQSAYLIGRERKVADIPTDNPSCSKQHAVFQYRLVCYERSDGTVGRTVKPYILDLESANGTFVNNRRIDPKCYVELFEKDVVKFGFSSREYVLLHEDSKESDDDLSNQCTKGMDLSPVSLLRSQ